MKKLLTALALTGLMVSLTGADELYVKNRHVPQVRVVEGMRYVELKPFAAALDQNLSKSGHGWLVGEKPADLPNLRPGEVWLGGTILKSRFVAGEVSISLGEAAKALGATLVPNKALKTTDFRLPRPE